MMILILILISILIRILILILILIPVDLWSVWNSFSLAASAIDCH